MPLVLGCVALAFPRLVLVLVWLFGSGYLGRAYDTWIWPVLGFFFLPTTTLAFAFASNTLGAAGEVPPLGWVLIIVAVLIDVGSWGNGERSRRRHFRKKSKR